MTTYDVTITRDENLWAAEVHGLPTGVVGAADWENLGDLHDELPSLVADLIDTDPAKIGLRYQYIVNDRDVTRELQHLRDTEHDLRSLQQDHERARKEAIAALTDAGLSRRVIGDAVGLSHQRVQQLING